MINKVILDLCGGTGSWSNPYKDAGYDVKNITLPDYNVRTYIPPDNVYGILSAPPCTMFSFARTKAELPRDLKSGMELVIACLKIIWGCQYKISNDSQKYSPLKFWVLENPFGMLNWFLGKPAMTFTPYEFGDNYQKKTCLWGHFNIPKKNPVLFFGPRFDKLKDKEIHYEGFEHLTRQERRAITSQKFAMAFFEANQ